MKARRQLFAQGEASTEQAAAHGTDWEVQDFGDLFISATIDFSQHENRSVFSAELGEGGVHELDLFVLFESGLGGRLVIDGLAANECLETVERHGLATAARVAHGEVESDAIQPRVKCRGAAERIELDVGLDESVLHDVAGVFGGTDHPKQRVVEPVLIQFHQPAEGCRISGKRGRDEWCVVAQDVLASLDAMGESKVPGGGGPELPAEFIVSGVQELVKSTRCGKRS
jgi:hypothetical protein